MAAPLFTVFTPTYNRAHTLHRVFDSLCAQTLRDFEWLVVDDGSTDDTGSIVAGWIGSADFPITYLRQEHGGKHIAYNRGLDEARGFFFAPLDSDDALLPDALERFVRHWQAIPVDRRAGFSGVGGLCSDQDGRIIGDRYPTSPLDSNLREIRYVYRVRGEKWGMLVTEVARRFRFPDIAATNFIPEGAIWLEMAKHYQHRFMNEAFRIYYVADDATGTTLTGRRDLHASAPGRLHYYLWLLNNDIEFLFRSPTPFLKAALMLPVVARHVGQPFREVWRGLNNGLARMLVLLLYPAALSLCLRERAAARLA